MEVIEKMLLSKIAKRTEEHLHEWNRDCVNNAKERRCFTEIFGLCGL